tara:strand:- start:26 stop:586 length:561 start_codon:yes stop_codon:yes gene_type:complete
MDNLLSKKPENLAQNLLLLRKKRKFTQEKLSSIAQIPRSTLTHMESGSGNPSLQNLVKVAHALSITLEELLAPPKSECQLIKEKDLPQIKRAKGEAIIYKLLVSPLPGTEIDKMELAPGTSIKGIPHIQGTKEYFSCFQGRFNLKISGETYHLNKGDVLIFPGDQNHSYINGGSGVAIGFSVVSLS